MNRFSSGRFPRSWSKLLVVALVVIAVLVPWSVVQGLSVPESPDAANADATVRLVTTPASGGIGDSFTTQIYLDNIPAPGLGSYQVHILYNNAIVDYASFTDAGLLGSTGNSVIPAPPADNPGELIVAAAAFGANNGPTGSNLLLGTVTWTGVGDGTTALDAIPPSAGVAGTKLNFVGVGGGAITPLVLVDSSVTVVAPATATPTDTPTNTPTTEPGVTATNTATPTDTPTFTPTNTPTLTPTNTPTSAPTNTPTSTPTLTPTNTPTVPPGGPLTLSVGNQTVFEGDMVMVDVVLSGAQDLGAYQFTLSFDPTVLDYKSVALGPFLGSTGRTVIPAPPVVGAGSVTVGASSSGAQPGANGGGVVATVKFQAVKGGASSLTLSAAKIIDTTQVEKTPAYSNGGITVTPVTVVIAAGDASLAASSVSNSPDNASSTNVTSGTVFNIPITVQGAHDLGSFQFTMTYNPAIVKILDVTLGDFIESTGRTAVEAGPTYGPGTVTYGAATHDGAIPGPSGSGVLANVKMLALQPGSTLLVMSNLKAQNTIEYEFSVSGQSGNVIVSGPSLVMHAPDEVVGLGQVFDVAIDISGAIDLASYQFTLNFDPSKVQVLDVMDAGFLTSTGRTFGGETGPSYGPGSVLFGAYTNGNSPNGPFGSGTLAIVKMKALAPGISPLELTNRKTVDTSENEREPAADNGSVTVKLPELRIEPVTTEILVGNEFQVEVWMDYAVDLGAFQFMLEWDSGIVQLLDTNLGPYLTSTGRTLGPVTENSSPGSLLYGATTLGNSPDGPTGTGLLATLKFKALAVGSTKLDLTDGVASSVENPNDPINIVERRDGTVSVIPPTPTPTPTYTPTPTATPVPIRFRGNTYRGPVGDTSSPLGGVEVQLWASTQCTGPLDLIKTTFTAADGFYNIYIENIYPGGDPPLPWDYFVLKVIDPAGLVVDGVITADGVMVDKNTVEWCNPTTTVHITDWFFLPPTPTPTPTFTPTPTPTDTPTPTPTPTYTPTPTATPTPTPEYLLYLPMILGEATQ